MAETQVYEVPDGYGGTMTVKLTPEDAERLHGIKPGAAAEEKTREAPNKKRTTRSAGKK